MENIYSEIIENENWAKISKNACKRNAHTNTQKAITRRNFFRNISILNCYCCCQYYSVDMIHFTREREISSFFFFESFANCLCSSSLNMS